VLFPIVGKVNSGRYTFDGKEYELGQHGFARDREFTFVSKSENEIVYALRFDEETLKKYPFRFELIISHRLEGNTLCVCWKVVNLDNRTMYFSIGGHPAFNVPAQGTGSAKEDYYLYFENKNEVRYKLLDPASGCVDNDNIHTLKTDGGFVKISEELFDNDAMIFDHHEVEKACLCYPDKKPYVTLDAKGFPAFGIWSAPKKHTPFICLEPWIGRADDKGFAGSLEQKYEEIALNAHEEFNSGYTISVD